MPAQAPGLQKTLSYEGEQIFPAGTGPVQLPGPEQYHWGTPEAWGEAEAPGGDIAGLATVILVLETP